MSRGSRSSQRPSVSLSVPFTRACGSWVVRELILGWLALKAAGVLRQTTKDQVDLQHVPRRYRDSTGCSFLASPANLTRCCPGISPSLTTHPLVDEPRIGCLARPHDVRERELCLWLVASAMNSRRLTPRPRVVAARRARTAHHANARRRRRGRLGTGAPAPRTPSPKWGPRPDPELRVHRTCPTRPSCRPRSPASS